MTVVTVVNKKKQKSQKKTLFTLKEFHQKKFTKIFCQKKILPKKNFPFFFFYFTFFTKKSFHRKFILLLKKTLYTKITQTLHKENLATSSHKNHAHSQQKHRENRKTLPLEHHISCLMCQIAISKNTEQVIFFTVVTVVRKS